MAIRKKEPEEMDVIITRPTFINGEFIEPEIDEKTKEPAVITLDTPDAKLLVNCNKAIFSVKEEKKKGARK